MFAFQQATPDDADQIARIIIEVGGGLVEQILDGLIPGLDSASILSAAFIKGEGPYRTDNVIRSRDGERLTSVLFAYPWTEHTVPQLLKNLIPAKRLAPVRLILEKSVPDSLYINTLWMDETLRREGHAGALLVEAESLCRLHGFNRMSMFCWNDNDEGMRFLAHHGFAIDEHLDRSLIPIDGHDKGGSIVCKTLKDA